MLKRLTALLLVILLVGSFVLYIRPVPKLQTSTAKLQVLAQPLPTLSWPSYGQAALGAQGYGVLATQGEQAAVPIASVAKIVTALAVIKQMPLKVGEQGPVIVLNTNDVAIYQRYASMGGSVVPVTDGEQISEYQALQALLLPSSNNMAGSLANWAFGSQDKYLAYANSFVAGLGLQQMHMADASGFAPETLGSAHDLVVLGEQLLNNPVLSEIVSQPQATVPVAGVISNTNRLLGTNGIIGIKTGDTDQAGGCYLFAANREIAGQQVKLIGVILGAADLNTALNDSVPLLSSADNAFALAPVAKKGQVVGSYHSKWNIDSDAVAAEDLSVLAWKGTKPVAAVSLNELTAPTQSNQIVGKVTVLAGQKSQSVPVILKQTIKKPTFYWHIFHL